MRIFCCSNPISLVASAITCRVSIRHADFLLFERHQVWELLHNRLVSIRHADFLLFEHRLRPLPPPSPVVSIRHADFLLFEHLTGPP